LREFAYACTFTEKYDAVHLNNGLHGWHLSDGEYEKFYRVNVETVLRRVPGAALILALTTPVTKANFPDQYDEKNDVVLRRNDAVNRIAQDYGLDVNDLYAAADKRPDICLADGVHYNDSGYRLLGEKVYNAIWQTWESTKAAKRGHE
jgi:lysophospholipase L1-like esterase